MSGRSVSARAARRAAAVLFVAAVLIGAGGAAFVVTAPARAASTAAVTSDAGTSVSVTAEPGFSFTPNTFQGLAVNSTVTITLTDNDAVDHTFTIIGKQGWVIPTDYSSAQIDSLAFGDAPKALINLNATSVGTPGDTVIGNVTVPAAGWYEFVCTEPGHFQEGMYGYIAFGMNLPGNLTVTTADTNPGVAVFIIVGTIVALVVIALVLGFVVGRRRGSTYEMPPQRLGYAEPETPGESSPPPGSAPPPTEPRG